MTTKRLAELDERASQIEQRLAELRDTFAGRERFRPLMTVPRVSFGQPAEIGRVRGLGASGC